MNINSEYGKLRRVVLCRPDYFKWLPVNASAKKALAEGRSFTNKDVQKHTSQEMQS